MGWTMANKIKEMDYCNEMNEMNCGLNEMR